MSPLLGRMAADVGRLKGWPLQRGAGWFFSPISISFSPVTLNFWMVWMPSSAASSVSSASL